MPGSFSCSVVFARYSTALGWVLRRSKEALVRAKEDNGRNSLSVEIMRGSGRSSVWTTGWQDHHNQRDCLSDFLQISSEAVDDKPVFSGNRFLHALERHLEMMMADGQRSNGLSTPLHYPGSNLAFARDTLALALRNLSNDHRKKIAEQDCILLTLQNLLLPPKGNGRNHNSPSVAAFQIMSFLHKARKGAA